jgi:hypothetical protein
MKKLGLRIGATVATLFAAGFVTRLVSTASQLEMNKVAIGQLENSDVSYMKFTMFDWLLSSGWGYVSMATVLVILYFIWKGQFKNVQE